MRVTIPSRFGQVAGWMLLIGLHLLLSRVVNWVSGGGVGHGSS